MTHEVFLVNGVRSPFGKHRGKLAEVRPDDLAAVVIERAVEASGIPSELVDEVIIGCANQAGEDNRNIARMALLLAGIPDTVPGYTVNRLCASGLTSIGNAYLQIAAGDSHLVVAGGVESMSRAPWVTGRPTKAFSGPTEVADSSLGWRFINPRMVGIDAGNATVSLGETAERVAELDGIDRQRSDDFALRSQQLAVAAALRGDLAGEILGVQTTSGLFDSDELPRAETTMANLAKLKPVFRQEGVVTAGSASPLSDGASAVVLASGDAVKKYGLSPLARVVGSASAGVQPSLMGLGPVPATKKLLSRVGISIDDLSVIEINEAFAPQVLACLDRLNIDSQRVNRWGGAIALGHPLGASGTRLALTAARQLQRSGGQFALVTMCVGVGQGTSLLLEQT